MLSPVLSTYLDYAIAYIGRNAILPVILILIAVTVNGVSAAETQKPSPVRSMQLAGEKNPLGVEVTRWPGDRPDDFVTYDDWKAIQGELLPLRTELFDRLILSSNAKETKLLCIMVNDSLLDSLQNDLGQFLIDLAYDGYAVEVFSSWGGTCQEMRQFLQGKYQNENLTGVLLMGNLPIAWYETFACWEDTPHEHFPCDLYFMDMDGEWYDSDDNGLYDEHTGNVTPEIFVGRLSASTLNYMDETEPSLIRNYLDKNHQYRIGQLAAENRALLYIDDDWASEDYWWLEGLQNAYDNIVMESDVLVTVADDYRSRLAQDYELIQVMVHSYPSRHYFKYNFQWHSYLYHTDIIQIDPVALFYNLFACSAGSFVQPNYLAGWSIFHPTSGLAALGSSKTGSMLNFYDFYIPFGENKTIGESFSHWFTQVGQNGYEDWEICWFYGMILSGDPTLRRDMAHETYPVVIKPTSCPEGVYYHPYEVVMVAAGGLPPYTWEIVEGALPQGLILETASGVIYGWPSTKGTFDARITASDTDIPPQTDTVDISITITCISGDANRDGNINIGDAVFLVNYVFNEGPAPDPLKAGDCNCDLAVNVADAVFLLTHIFHEGPEPLCP